jgi:hypothetical protein
VAGEWFHRFEGAGLDGVIAKHESAAYQPGKRAMIKVKHARTADCVVAGFRWHKNGPASWWVRSCSASTTRRDAAPRRRDVVFHRATRRELARELEPLRKDALAAIPGASGPGRRADRRACRGQSRWSQGKDLSWEPLRVERVCEVKYDHLQGDRFRHAAVFERWRPTSARRSAATISSRSRLPRSSGRSSAREAGILKPVAAVLVAVVAGAGRSALAEWRTIEKDRATLVYEESALTAAEAARFANLLDQGIADVESYLRPAAPDGLREGPIVYRVGADLPYSMTRGRTVSLMVERVRTDSAPYLHETVHVLVPSPNRSVWLREGFASYVESYVSENIGGYDAHVFARTATARGRGGGTLAGPRRRTYGAPVGGDAGRAAGDGRGAAARGRAVLRPVPVLLEVPGW